MEQITVAVLTLLALYILYSECIKLPMIIKQNKKLCYLVVGGIFLYDCANRNVDGLFSQEGEASILPPWQIIVGLLIVVLILLTSSKGYSKYKSGTRGANLSQKSFSAASSPQ